MRLTIRAGLGALLLLALVPSGVAAHAQLLSSVPAPDEVLTVLPTALVLTYDDELTAASNFIVVDASGATLATGTLDPANPKSMTVATPTLSNGSYEIRWTAGTTDGHIERATFAFSVALATTPPGTPGPNSGPTAPATSGPSDVQSGPSLPGPSLLPTGVDGGSGPSSGDTVIAIVAAVVIVGGGLAFFLRRQRA